MTSEREVYVYMRLPATLETVPAARLKAQTLPEARRSGLSGVFSGRCCRCRDVTGAGANLHCDTWI